MKNNATIISIPSSLNLSFNKGYRAMNINVGRTKGLYLNEVKTSNLLKLFTALKLPHPPSGIPNVRKYKQKDSFVPGKILPNIRMDITNAKP